MTLIVLCWQKLSDECDDELDEFDLLHLITIVT